MKFRSSSSGGGVSASVGAGAYPSGMLEDDAPVGCHTRGVRQGSNCRCGGGGGGAFDFGGRVTFGGGGACAVEAVG